MIFDFWKIPGIENPEISNLIGDLDNHVPVYVFVSHFHKDHFNKAIFSWQKFHPNIHFIISKDTSRHVKYILNPASNYIGERPTPDSVVILQKLEVFEDLNIRVTAFGSTDIGNSYIVELKQEDKKIFHAGDLNCWTWKDESSPDEIREAEEAYRKELYIISNDFAKIDIAMFPVDKRIGSGYAQGAKEFLEAIEVAYFFPMHFGLGETPEEQSIYIAGAQDIEKYAFGRGEIITLTSPGDCFYKSVL